MRQHQITRCLLSALHFLFLLSPTGSSHFMGAVITFKTNPTTPNKATFYWKAAWKIGRGPCSNSACTEADIGRLGTNVDKSTNDGNVFKCHVGCTDPADQVQLAGPEYWITAVSTAEDYEMGENIFEHIFASAGPFEVGMHGAAWRALSVITVTNPSWKVFARVLFGNRSDTGKPNNSPLTSSLPIYNLQFNCAGKIQLPLVDPDGDNVKCRWGITSNECGDVCEALPGVQIEEDTCILSISTDSSQYVADGWYVGTVVLEDFPKTTMTMGGITYTPSDALSRVPVQFLVKTPDFSSGCSAKPVFVSPTPDQDTVYYLEPSGSVGIPMYAVNEEDTTAVIIDFRVVSPHGAVASNLNDDDLNRPRVKYMEVQWTPTLTQSGAHTICFIAIDSSGKFSEYRCVYIYANDVDECESSPCQNGGTCNNLENIYTCSCVAGATGYNCEQDTADDCIGNSCLSGSTCVDGLGTYTCTCLPGYTGPLCTTNIDECISSPCDNGGVCTDNIDGYTCTCTDGWNGTHCQVDINECESNPCMNEGECLDDINGYRCLCANGWNGTHCELDIDECVSSPCENGGMCTDNIDGYSCTCTDGWNGPHCQININECESNPCMNEGECLDDINGYRCLCENGWNGTHCELDIDECVSSPCNNGGVCTDNIDGYTCTCTDGWNGTHCQVDINECESNPCMNEGECLDDINGYRCLCGNGWNGTHCELDIDECVSNPCMNEGECLDDINGYRCLCENGWNGTHCELDIDECVSNPCIHGNCTDNINGYTCSCLSGYEGSDCQYDINECRSNPCMNEGECLDDINGYRCLCENGWNGTHCELDIDECVSNPCIHGNCTDNINGYTCSCQSGYEGSDCQYDINECESNPCLNGGTCIDGENSFTCTCISGLQGTQCEEDVDECDGSPCNNGTCLNLFREYRCLCDKGYAGLNCSIDIDECKSNPCVNASSCVNQIGEYACLCIPGFTGHNCSIDIDDCISSPCQNNGVCNDQISGYSCSCEGGWTGEFCEHTELPMCTCESIEEWSGLSITAICECVEDFTMSSYQPSLEKSMPCRRNNFVIVIAVVLGFFIATIVFAMGLLAQDLNRRYDCLLKGQEPNSHNKVASKLNNLKNVSPTSMYLEVPDELISQKGLRAPALTSMEACSSVTQRMRGRQTKTKFIKVTPLRAEHQETR